MWAIPINATLDLEPLGVFFLCVGHLRKKNVDVILANRVRVVVVLSKFKFVHSGPCANNCSLVIE